MKLIKRTTLSFTEGNSDKVYEVDLCEHANNSEQRYLVNFRYGRRGTNLREGSKTPEPVDLAKAEAIFTSLIVSKTNKGYLEKGASKPPKAAYSAKPINSVDDLLQQIQDEKDSKLRARLIWRLPQQTNAVIADALIQDLNKGEWQELYSRLWVIGRTGELRHAEAIQRYVSAQDEKIADLALEVLLQLGESNAETRIQRQLTQYHSKFIELFNSQNVDEIAAYIKRHYSKRVANDAHSQLKLLYLLAAKSEAVYQALLKSIPHIAVEPGAFKGLRYIFKMAEFRLDSKMFAALSHHFEKEKAYFSNTWNWAYAPGVGYLKVSDEITKPTSRLAYSNRTRNYLRRRSWRALKRLGIRNDDRYAEMATEVLLSFRAEDKKDERKSEYYDWSQRKTFIKNFDGYASYLAFNGILRSNSQQFEYSSQSSTWHRIDGEDEGRTDAFPAIWDRHPHHALRLLIQTDIDIIADFAVNVLQDKRDFYDSISDEQIQQLLCAPTAQAIEFAVKLLETREISQSLLLLLLRSNNEKAATIALRQLNNVSAIFSQHDFASELLTINNPMLMDWLAEKAQSYLFGYSDQVLLEKTLNRLMQQNELSETQAYWLADFFTRYLQQAVYDFSFELLQQLYRQQSIGHKLLAVKLIVVNRISFSMIPSALLEDIQRSLSPDVRAAGISLFAKTADYELLDQLPLLSDIIYRGEASERQACFDLLTRLQPQYDHLIFQQLLPLVFRKEEVEGQQDALFSFMTEKLADECYKVDKDMLWRVIHASSVSAQRLGMWILQNYNVMAFTIKQWVALASNTNQSVRQTIHQAFNDNVAFIKTSSKDALRILESNWQDTREFGFDYFRKQYQEQDWSVELIVSVCDSNLVDTQQFGRELLQTFFKQEQGETYLLQLSQHPSVQVQSFVSQLLNDYASGKPDIILSLQQYFTSVLSQINKARISKDTVLNFLIREANSSEMVLKMVADLFSRLSLSVVHKDKSQLIKAMLQLKKKHPELDLPIMPQSVRVIATTQGENHAS